MIITETLRDQLADTLLQINTRAVKCKTTLNQCWVRVSALSTDQQKICSRSWFVFESISQYFIFFFCLGIYKALSVSVSPWLAWAVHAGHIKWWSSDNAACFPWLSQHISSGSWNLVEPTFTYLFIFFFFSRKATYPSLIGSIKKKHFFSLVCAWLWYKVTKYMIN